MGLSHPQELRQRLERLVTDVGDLQTASGIGFSHSDAAMVRASVDHLEKNLALRVVDVRQGTQADKADRLEAALRQEDASVVLLTSPVDAVGIVASVVGAYVDQEPGRRIVDVDGARAIPCLAHNLVVVCDGCDDGPSLPAALARISYWEFVP